MKSPTPYGRGAARLLDLLYVDRVVVSAVLARIWPFLAGPVSVALILRYFTPEVQGLYYGFSEVVKIQSFFELGFSSLLISMAGHEAAGMRGDTSAAPEQARARLAWLWRGALRWYAMTGALFFTVAAIVGWLTFARHDTTIGWRAAWLVILPLAAASMWLTPWIAVLEGSGYRADVYRYRLYQAVTGNFVVWTAILVGAGLWAVVAATAVQLVWLAYLALKKFRPFFQMLAAAPPPPGQPSWWREVVPIQWRLAVQSMAYFLATQVFTLVILAYHGVEAGGRLGMTMSLATAVQSVAMVWIQTRYPVMAALAASGRRSELDRMWTGITAVSLLVLASGIIGFAAALYLLGIYWPTYGARFIPPAAVLLLGVGMAASHVVGAQSHYILAHRRQPLFQATMFGLGATAAVVWICGAWWGVTGLAVGYACVSTCVYLPAHSWAYVRDRQRIAVSEQKAN